MLKENIYASIFYCRSAVMLWGSASMLLNPAGVLARPGFSFDVGGFMRMYPCCSANFEMSTHVSWVCLHCCLNLTMATCVTCLQSVEVKNFLISGAQIVCMVSFAYICRYSRYYLLFFWRFSFCLTAYSPQLHPQKTCSCFQLLDKMNKRSFLFDMLPYYT